MNGPALGLTDELKHEKPIPNGISAVPGLKLPCTRAQETG